MRFNFRASAKRVDRLASISPIYVDRIPDELIFGELYISVEFGTAAHLCACGCGREAFTPTQPEWTDGWSLVITDNLVTLRPSIGNFKGESPYHAHYYITNNKIEWL